MLNKRELSKVEIPKLSDEIYIDKLKNLNYFCQASIIFDSENHQHLMLTVWDKNYRVCPVYITFIDKDTNDFCTRNFTEIVYKDHNGKYYAQPRHVKRNKPIWSEAMLENLVGSSWNYDARRRCLQLWIVNDGSVRTIAKYFGLKKHIGTIDDIDNFQKAVREKELKVRIAKRKTDIEKIMSQVTDLPEDWDNFITDYAALPYRYVLYKRESKNKITGFCTNCRKNVVLTKEAAHNAPGICPNCASKITYKAIGKSKNLQDHFGSDYLQPIQGGFILRCFENDWYFSNKKDPTRKVQYERLRFLIDYSGKITMYDKPYEAWRKRSYADYSPLGRLYPHNLSCLEGTKWQYSAIDIMAKNSSLMSTTGYLQRYIQAPLIEYIVKLGLYRIAGQKSWYLNYSSENVINWNGTDIISTFKLPKEYIPLLKKINAGIEEVDIIQWAFLRGIEISETDFQGFLKVKVTIFEIKEIINICVHYRFKIKKILMYFAGQKRSDESISHVINMWRDYISFAEKLKYNLQDEYYLFPKKLIEAHDKANTIVEVRKNTKNNRLIKKRWKELDDQYYFETKYYLIRAPKSAEEFICEANKLKHCVATNYMSPHAEGKTIILFIRQKAAPDEPFYTVELKDEKIRQIQTAGHKGPTPEVKKFTDQWLRKKVNQHNKPKTAVRVTVPA